jgi:hopene-associated glycosyltransferase HpnB
MIIAVIWFIPVAVWLWLLLRRGWFWRCTERDDAAASPKGSRSDAPATWPSIVAIIPARDEAELIPHSIGSLLRQDYHGRFSIIVVDDQSADDTSAAALSAAKSAGGSHDLRVVRGRDLPGDWTGKLWAMRQGIARLDADPEAPDFVLFTDADISFAPHMLRRLVSIARRKDSVLTSLMVKLRCESPAEKWLAPAFVFFFQMLYPFAWANDPKRKTAAAAGGCMLARRKALAAAGGLEALRGTLIDDCALAAVMKRQGPIWLGLTEDAQSLRAYPSFADFGRMVSRSAFAELRYSPLRLAAVVVGISIVYLAPPFLTIFARGEAQAAGAFAWALMAFAFAPTLHLYRRPLFGGFALPAIAAAYVLFTLQSALQYWRGKGGYWKGRVQASTS